jgi:hypothetical protein
MARQLSSHELRLLVGLADGSLPPEQCDAAERELRARPETAAALERQERAVAAVRGAAVSAPAELRERVEAMRAQRRAPLRRGRTSWRPALASALAAALLALVAIVLLDGSPGDPGVQEVAALAERGVSAPAPPPDRAREGLLAEEAESIRYPDWSGKFGWRAVGAREDELAGRRAETVFYEHMGHRIGYTILAGAALDPPPNARRMVRNGVALYAYKDGPRDVVVFERRGRTCVLSGDVLSRRTLLKLAAWRPA